ncbi:MAG: hypothetical protein ABJA74_09920 [Lapillicoccus sp.]
MVGSMLAFVGGVGAASAAPSAAPGPHKSYVCKYVSKPGVAERLQTGQNPIWVDNHSLLGYDGTVTVGQQFKDGQFRSVVIVANTVKLTPEPSVADCPPVTPPTTPPPTCTSHCTPPPTCTSHCTSTTTPPPSHSSSTGPSSSGSSSSAPGSKATTYPLQPVNAGVVSQAPPGGGITPVRLALVLLAVVGVWLLVFGARAPAGLRLTRLLPPRKNG